jgi:TolB-like protein/DNA-binding SARP family transcriptional activator
MGMETNRELARSRKGGRARSEPGKALRDDFQLRLLGPLSATRQGLDIQMPSSRKVRALLGYLALAPRPKLRSHLCELLWDVANDPRSELRWCLTKLRTVIDDAGRRRLISNGQWVSIDVSDRDVDAIAFSQSIEKAIAEGSVVDLKRLTATIHGEFLEGLAVDRSPMFDNWLHGQRHRFMSWHSQALARLASLMPGDHEDVLAILRKRIDLVPLDEQAHIDLMRALTTQGHIVEAEQHIATTVGLYEREGLNPTALREAWFASRRVRVTASPELKHTQANIALGQERCLRTDSSGQPFDPPQLLCARRASIAIMPFEPLAAAGNSLADGLTNDIIIGLAKLRSLFVIAPGTAFTLRDRGLRAPEAGTLLGVDYIATGTVRMDAPRMRISLQLCAQESGRILWADEYDSRTDDAPMVPATIATRIVSCLEAEIRLAECNRAIVKPPNSLDAWEAHHRGLWHMYRFTEADNDEARRWFQRAIARDPTFSRAYAGLSFTHWQNAFTFKPTQRQPETDRAFDAAGRGLQADPQDPAAHWAFGRALWLRKEEAASLNALNEAVALSPSFAIAHYTRGFVESQTGDAAVAVHATDVARQLSPFDPMLYAMCCARAFALIRLGSYDEAAEWAIRAARKPNAHVQAHALSALILAVAGRLKDALREVDVVRRLRPTYTIDDFLSSYRVLGSEESAYKTAARRIGIS